MKPFSPVAKTSFAQARNAALLNQFATPGLGSLLARRWWAGAGQLALALVGFALVLVWFVKLMSGLWSLSSDLNSGPTSAPQMHFWLLKIGAVTFAVAWLWSLVTSVQLLRAAKNSPPKTQAPPILPR